jgi:hypothetical protein
MIKVIHVHLIWEKKDFYFGSLSAIFKVIDEHRLGMTKNTLLHQGMSDGSTVPTKNAIIKQSHLIRSSGE